MEWFSVDTAIINSDLPDGVIASWLRVSAWFAALEDDSCQLPDAGHWPRSYPLTRAEHDELMATPLVEDGRLVGRVGDDVRRLRGQRTAGRDGGKKGGRPRKTPAKNPKGSTEKTPPLNPDQEPTRQDKTGQDRTEDPPAPPVNIDDAMASIEAEANPPTVPDDRASYPTRDVLDRSVMPGTVADLVAGFGAVVTDIDRQDWDALIRHHGFTRVSEACSVVRAGGQRAWLSHVRDHLLAKVQANETWPQRAWKHIRDLLLADGSEAETIRTAIEEHAGRPIAGDASEGKLANYALANLGPVLEIWIGLGWIPPRDG